jgi:hypothetical protein
MENATCTGAVFYSVGEICERGWPCIGWMAFLFMLRWKMLAQWRRFSKSAEWFVENCMFAFVELMIQRLKLERVEDINKYLCLTVS